MSLQKYSLYNLAGTIVPLVAALITIPIYINTIGDHRYGVLAIVWLVLAYFNVFNFGLGRALAQLLAASLNHKAQHLATAFWTAFIANLFVALLGGAFLYTFIQFMLESMSIDANLLGELRDALPLLVGALIVATSTSVLTGALHGKSKFVAINIITVVTGLTVQVSPLLVALFVSVELRYLVGAVVVSKLIGSIFYFYCCYCSLIKGTKFQISLRIAKGLLSYGGWATISSIISPLMVALDRLAIGALLGSKYVSYYSIPYQLAERTTIPSAAITSAAFPRMADETPLNAKNTSLKTLSAIISLTTPIVIFCIYMLGEFLEIWISSEFSDHACLTAQIFFVGFWVNSIARVPFAKLQAEKKPDIVAKCHLAELLPYLVLLYFGLTYFGLPGAAFAFTLRASADCLLLLYYASILTDSFLEIAMQGVLILATFLSSVILELEMGTNLVLFLLMSLFSVFRGWKVMPESVKRSFFSIIGLTNR